MCSSVCFTIADEHTVHSAHRAQGAGRRAQGAGPPTTNTSNRILPIMNTVQIITCRPCVLVVLQIQGVRWRIPDATLRHATPRLATSRPAPPRPAPPFCRSGTAIQFLMAPAGHSSKMPKRLKRRSTARLQRVKSSEMFPRLDEQCARTFVFQIRWPLAIPHDKNKELFSVHKFSTHKKGNLL